MWNYRVVKEMLKGEPYYLVAEVYYEEDNDDHPHSWTGPVSPRGETREELKEDLNRWLKAFSKPVLVAAGERSNLKLTGETEPPFAASHIIWRLTESETPAPGSPSPEGTALAPDASLPDSPSSSGD